MTDLAPHVTAFLRDHLPHERRFSRHTVQSYTESLKLLVVQVAARLDIRPSTLTVEHFTVPVVLHFLDSLERERNNTIGTPQHPSRRHQGILPLPRIPRAGLSRPSPADPRDSAQASRQAPHRLARPQRDAGVARRPGQYDRGRSA